MIFHSECMDHVKISNDKSAKTYGLPCSESKEKKGDPKITKDLSNDDVEEIKIDPIEEPTDQNESKTDKFKVTLLDKQSLGMDFYS